MIRWLHVVDGAAFTEFCRYIDRSFVFLSAQVVKVMHKLQFYKIIITQLVYSYLCCKLLTQKNTCYPEDGALLS